jgi:hypothetical protein
VKIKGSEPMSSETISRRRAVPLLGSLAGVAALGIAVPTTMLTVSDAEAQTAGMTRRQARREGRRERRETRREARRAGRETRRAVRRGTAPQ